MMDDRYELARALVPFMDAEWVQAIAADGSTQWVCLPGIEAKLHAEKVFASISPRLERDPYDEPIPGTCMLQGTDTQAGLGLMLIEGGAPDSILTPLADVTDRAELLRRLDLVGCGTVEPFTIVIGTPDPKHRS